LFILYNIKAVTQTTDNFKSMQLIFMIADSIILMILVISFTVSFCKISNVIKTTGIKLSNAMQAISLFAIFMFLLV